MSTKSTELSNNLRDISAFVNRLPVSNETKNGIYNILTKIVRNPSSINDTIAELKDLQIIPIAQPADPISYDDSQHQAQIKLNELIDLCWTIIPEQDESIQLHEICGKIREFFIELFHILTEQQKTLVQQQKQIDDFKDHIKNLQIPSDEILLGSLAVQLIIKMGRFINNNESPTLSACRTVSMLMVHDDIQQLKTLIENHGFNFQEICLSAQMLKNNRNSAAHPCDPTTSLTDIQCAINRLFPMTSHPKRLAAEKVLEVLEILSKELKEPLFLQID